MVRLLTLPYVAEEVLPDQAVEASRLASDLVSRGQKIESYLSNISLDEKKDDAETLHVYGVMDTLRRSAKDAENFTNRAFNITHMMVSMLQSAYPSAGASPALQLLHRLHLDIGKAKGAVGVVSEPSTTLDSKEDDSHAGAMELLRAMERRIGKLLGQTPGSTQVLEPDAPALPAKVKGASVAPDVTLAAAMLPLHMTARGRRARDCTHRAMLFL
mmetsp:Transcript_66127/g.123381  ORF Transcript_66127/g.123381 Transcript_66127/m.123381 type:complete len:215 (+) Transcript_66127:53-697(+)